MTTRSRLLDPLRRFPAQDDVSRALAAVFGAEVADASAFSGELLRRVPLARLWATVEELRKRHGALRGVRRRGELYRVQFARGAELVWAQVSPEGKLTALVTGPGAVAACRPPLPSQSRTDLPTIPDGAEREDSAEREDGTGVTPSGAGAAAPGGTGTTSSSVEAAPDGAEAAAPGSAGAAPSGAEPAPGGAEAAPGGVGAAAPGGPKGAGAPARAAGSTSAAKLPPMPGYAPRVTGSAPVTEPQVAPAVPVPVPPVVPPPVPGSAPHLAEAAPAVAPAASAVTPVPAPPPVAVVVRRVAEAAPAAEPQAVPTASAVAPVPAPPLVTPPVAVVAPTPPVVPPPVPGSAPAVEPQAVRSRGLVAVSRVGGGRGGAAALSRLALGYLAATAAIGVLPYLTGTATGWLLLVATAPALGWYALRTGPTHALPPWFRALPPAAVGLAVLAGLRALPVFGPGLPWSRPGIPEAVLFAAGLGLAGWTWRRSRPLPSPSAHPLVLSFPLRGGHFTFTEAGGPAVNRYAQESLTPGAPRHRRHSVDLVQLGEGPQWRGRRALGLAPSGNERYAIFGHPVLSPCDGVVVAAVDGLPDHLPYAPAADHPEGNHIAIDTGRALVVLSWLRQDSIRVRRGQHLTAGTPVAAVGVSGDGGEPALHLRAETRTSQSTPGSGLGLPFRFEGLRGAPLRGRRLRLPD
ncbi:peptidoglycan DD-metalloendopeptidase family protein [Streptacidiphilus cavernicola]|uniref:Peptidoglycan DD-metalloendopeptidase family protein n=1 Tax=Streptacidiphilus cavernicola TaxID=3342716 RepID=A0ABV6VXE3_9ACTN